MGFYDEEFETGVDNDDLKTSKHCNANGCGAHWIPDDDDEEAQLRETGKLWCPVCKSEDIEVCDDLSCARYSAREEVLAYSDYPVTLVIGKNKDGEDVVIDRKFKVHNPGGGPDLSLGEESNGRYIPIAAGIRGNEAETMVWITPARDLKVDCGINFKNAAGHLVARKMDPLPEFVEKFNEKRVSFAKYDEVMEFFEDYCENAKLNYYVWAGAKAKVESLKTESVHRPSSGSIKIKTAVERIAELDSIKSLITKKQYDERKQSILNSI
jgi:hypothetical protein